MNQGTITASLPDNLLDHKLNLYPQVICTILLTIFLNFPAFTQGLEIIARVIDSTNLQPVPFSTIFITEGSGTIADETGFFRMQVSPENLSDTLHISCVGFLGKKILVREMSLTRLDSIFLQPHIIELNEVSVEARARKPPAAKDIIRFAIRNIPENYPDSTVLYNGYYREYVKKDEQYINLFESIINLEDPGFESIDDFNAGLIFKRINQDFPVDSQLMRPYDNRDKFVPYSFMPIPLNNELVILRAHDPVRNFNRESLYFIGRLEKDFIRNHDFDNPKLTYLGDRPYYYINFKDNKKYTIGINRISLKGTIYIDALNYGIKRLNYRATIDNGVTRQKLFELSLEYRLVDNIYMLHYLSFNNLFQTRNFTLRETSIYDDKLQLIFNKPLNPEDAGNPDNLTVYLENREQEIKKIELKNNSMLITFSEKSPVSGKLKINLLPRNITTRKKIADNEKYLFNNLHFEFRNFRDLQGNAIQSNEFNKYYQYREFFTNLISQENNGITSNLIDKTKPVIENRVFGEYSGDTSWLNTPLIEENVVSRKIYSRDAKMNRFLEALSMDSENKLNDIIYIHTDREVYAPGDTLWFKAYIRNRKYLTESRLSETFNILLVNDKGTIIEQEKFLNTGSGAHGQLLLDNTLADGTYFVTGYSSWMENFDINGLYNKKILVLKDRQYNLRLAATFDKPGYFPGDTIRLLVNCYDGLNRNVDEVNFSYRFVSGRDLLARGSGNTSYSWMEPLTMVVPAGLDTVPVIQFRSNYQSGKLDTVLNVPVHQNIHVDFFPEGGYCINGTETDMAFKAVTGDGNPVEIKGEIIDQDGQEIASAASRFDGMGVFPYKPQENGTCYFRITRPECFNKIIALPGGRKAGWLLHLQKDNRNSNYLELEISNVNAGNDTALITLTVRGYLCYWDFIITGKKKTVRIPTEDLPRGIAVLTLFNNRLLPQAERLVCIYPDCQVKAELHTDRQKYVPRDSVNLFVRLACEKPLVASGSFSLSVTDDQLCSSPMLDEPGIVTSLLLSPEIHGEVHNPGHYLDLSDNSAAGDLDLLLMTQGWRNYEYLAKIVDSINLVRPQNMDAISGHLMKQPLGGESRPTDGSLIVYFGGNSTVIPVNKDGVFSFIPDYASSSNTGIFLYAEDKNKKSNLSIILDSSAFENNMQAYIRYLADSMGRITAAPRPGQYRLQDYFSLNLDNNRWLEEVIIRGTARKKKFSTADLAFSKRKADQEELDLAVFMQDLETMVYKFNRNSAPVYYCIDGILQYTYDSGDGRSPPKMIPDYTYAYYIKPEQIAEYTVISGPEVQALYGYRIEYIIDVKTKPFSERKESRKWENPVRIEKYAVSKEFYKPVYDTEEKRSSTIPDLRKTIHWEPELRLAEDGTANIRFYNGDRYTRIRCTLEGITEDGIPVRADYFYDVTLTGEK